MFRKCHLVEVLLICVFTVVISYSSVVWKFSLMQSGPLRHLPPHGKATIFSHMYTYMYMWFRPQPNFHSSARVVWVRD